MKTKKILLVAGFAIMSSHSGAATVAGFDTELYGFVKASAFYADKALASYNNINLSAPTHAVAETRPQDSISRMSFQTQQSRVGLNIKKNQVSSKLEFDFIDFNKSSPTTQMVPRVRIASVTYAWDNQKVIIGQDWDLFSPVTSYTYDYVGLYFLAGNTGFMRQQLQYLNEQGSWEFGAAIGMAGNNATNTDGNLEQGKSPTYALRASKKLQLGRIGVSAIYSSLSYELQNAARRDAYGLNWFYEQILGRIAIKSELYYGQNLANLGSLSIGQGNATNDVREFGGTLTATYKLADRHSIFGGAGMAKVDNRNSITPFALNTTNNNGAIQSPGIHENIVTRVGYEFKVNDDLSWLSEISRFQTVSKIAASKFQQNTALGLESGIQLRF